MHGYLSVKIHIHELCLRLRKFVGIFYKLSQKLPPSVLKMLYFSFIYPHIIYGIEIYANTYLTYLHDLIILNNRLLRILQHKPFNSNSDELYYAYVTLPIPKLYQSLMLQFAHKLRFNPSTLPTSFQANILTNDNIHSHNTRSCQDFHRVSSFSLHFRRQSPTICARLWNSILPNLKSQISVNLFKRGIREFLYTNNLCSV